ncbi:MAG: TolC family protein [Bacteroidales bacterium]|nr:TolC family protein [Bacteroidales bacterium]
MKKIVITLACLIQFGFVNAQSVTLDQCQDFTRANYPVLRQMDFLQEISDLNQENLKTNYLPNLNLNGQITYQSDVTSIDLPIPNIDIPEVSKDQYKIYLELKQSIWDAGLTEASKDIEEVARTIGLKQVEIELFALRQQLNDAFFMNLLISSNIQQLNESRMMLNASMKVIESGFRNGVIEENNVDQLKAELLLLDQKLVEMNSAKETMLSMLSMFTAQKFDSNTNFEIPEVSIVHEKSFKRPEFEFLSQNQLRLDKMDALKTKTRLPQLFGFGQAGYGKPGLNMLKSEFDVYYLVGLGMSWNVFDWKKTKKERQIIGLKKQIIDTQKQELEFRLNMLLDRNLKEIGKLEKLLLTDSELVELRKKISNRSASKLKNGTITSADYLQDVNAETTAKINLETRKLKLIEAIIMYNTTKGL